MDDSSVLIRIVDDDEGFALSQKMLIGSLGWRVKVYTSARALLDEGDFTRPGCIILDVRMPEMTGLDLQKELENKKCNLPIIFLSAHGDIDMVVHAMRHGAVTFLQKPVEPQKLLVQVTKTVATCIRRFNEKEQFKLLIERVNKLSYREREIAQLVSEGLRNKEIARKLNIEESTVKMHRANAMSKLMAKTGAELTRIFTIVELKKNGDV